MKHTNKSVLFFSILTLLLLTVVLPVSANAPQNGVYSDGVIFGDYTLANGETNNGDLVIIGGNVLIEEGSTINGALAMFGSNAIINGKINGDVVSFGGNGKMGDTAYVQGSLVSFGSAFSIAEKATILGETVVQMDKNLPIPPVTIEPHTVPSPNVSPITIQTNPGLDFLRKVFSTAFMVLAISALGLLIGILFPKHLQKTTLTLVREPVKSGVLGLLSIFIAPIVFVILAITIILLPVSLLAMLALAILMLYGWVAVGYEIGHRIETSMKGNWEPSIIAGIGTLVLSSIAALVNLIPCVGFLIYPIVLSVGLGGVLISQFGRKEIAGPAAVQAEKALPEPSASEETTPDE